MLLVSKDCTQSNDERVGLMFPAVAVVKRLEECFEYEIDYRPPSTEDECDNNGFDEGASHGMRIKEIMMYIYIDAEEIEFLHLTYGMAV